MSVIFTCIQVLGRSGCMIILKAVCDLCYVERYELVNSLPIVFIHCFAYLLIFFCCSTQL